MKLPSSDEQTCFFFSLLVSLAYAAAEFGMEFGNNGDAPEHLTSNIYNAKSASAWPIVSQLAFFHSHSH